MTSDPWMSLNLQYLIASPNPFFLKGAIYIYIFFFLLYIYI